MTFRAISLSALAVCLCAATQCAAQDLPGVRTTPTIRLSSEETATAKRLTDELKKAQDRATVAKANWDAFEKEFGQSHREVGPWPTFSSDLIAAYTVWDNHAPVPVATEVKLTADEHRKAEALYNELKSSYGSQQQAEKDWSDFQSEFLVKHVPGVSKVSAIPSGQQGVTLPDGEQYLIPAPWWQGIALTLDFETATPRSL
jgi:hypothetical protein